MGKWATYRRRGGGGPPPPAPLVPPSFSLLQDSANPVIDYTVDAITTDTLPPGADQWDAGFSSVTGGPYTFTGPADVGFIITSPNMPWGIATFAVARWTLAGVPVSDNSAEQSIAAP